MQPTDRHQDDAGIAQRYLAGQLSPEEQEAYEQYFIHNPDAVRELEATARMKVGLASLRDKRPARFLVARCADHVSPCRIDGDRRVSGGDRDRCRALARCPCSRGRGARGLRDAPGRCVGEAARERSGLRGDAHARDWTTMRSSRYLRSLRRSSCVCCLNRSRLLTTLLCPEFARRCCCAAGNRG